MEKQFSLICVSHLRSKQISNELKIFFSLLKFLSIYFKVQVTMRERETKEDSLSRWFLQPGLGQTEDRSFILASYVDGRGPGTWAIFHCFVQTTGKELFWKWNGQDSNQCPYGVARFASGSFTRFTVTKNYNVILKLWNF